MATIATKVELFTQVLVLSQSFIPCSCGIEMLPSTPPCCPAPWRDQRKHPRFLRSGQLQGKHVSGNMHDAFFIRISFQCVSHELEEPGRQNQIIFHNNHPLRVAAYAGYSLNNGFRASHVAFPRHNFESATPMLSLGQLLNGANQWLIAVIARAIDENNQLGAVRARVLPKRVQSAAQMVGSVEGEK